MATRLWVGTDPGNEGDPLIAANWSPAGAPATGDDLILRESSQNLNGASHGAGVDLASVSVHPSFVGTIGSSGAHWIFNATIVQMQSGGSETWIEGETTSGIDDMISAPMQNGANACVLDGKFNKVQAMHGRVSAIGATSLFNFGTDPQFIVSGQGGGRQSVRVFLPTGVVMTNLTVNNGFVETKHDVTGATIINGGTLLQTDGVISKATQNGGVHWHDDGTVTLTSVHGGMYDSSRTSRSGKILTELRVYGPRGKFNLKNRAGVGKPATLVLYGHPSFDDGQRLTVV